MAVSEGSDIVPPRLGFWEEMRDLLNHPKGMKWFSVSDALPGLNKLCECRVSGATRLFPGRLRESDDGQFVWAGDDKFIILRVTHWRYQ